MRKLVWTVVDAHDAAPLLAEFSEPLGGTPEGVVLKRTTLPFYQDYVLYGLFDPTDAKAEPLLILYKPGDVNVMNTTNEVIYRVNAKAPIQLDKNNLVAYARFFFDHVKGRHGRFTIVESPDEVVWAEPGSQDMADYEKMYNDRLKVLPPEEAANPGPIITVKDRATLDAAIKPVAYKGIGRDSRYTLDARVLFQDALFKTNIKVSADGTMELTDEDPVVENVAVVLDKDADYFGF
jgi:hypothetical protein